MKSVPSNAEGSWLAFCRVTLQTLALAAGDQCYCRYPTAPRNSPRTERLRAE